MSEFGEDQSREQWLAVVQAYPEIEWQARFDARREIGRIALASVSLEAVGETEPNDSTLMAAIQMAAMGDERSYNVVFTNTTTDMVERMFKIGQTRVMLDATDTGFEQDGRTITDVHRNTFKHVVLNSEMHERTAGQFQNGFTFNALLAAGVFETHDALIFEPCTLNAQTKKEYNFFEETDSLSMQLLTTDGDKGELQTAFVAAKTTPDASRTDLQTIQKLADKKNIKLMPTDVNGLVQFVMLLPKTDKPRRIEEIVKEYDEINGGTFYGQDKLQEDYGQFAEQCYRRNESFNDIAVRITDQLISEAAAFASPWEAVRRLDYLSSRLCVEYAATNHEIDPVVFGSVSAAYLDVARQLHEEGDEIGATAALRKAQEHDTSNSCPQFKGAKDSSDDGGDGEKSESKWMNCPYCSAKVFADPCAKILSCWDCKAKVINGVTFKGDGGSKKRKEEKLQRLAERKEAQAQLTAV